MSEQAVPNSGARPPVHRGFRPDIQGLRAIAVGVVLLFHANAPFLPGGFVGVDVFFVISGFLITGLLVREAERSGRIDLAGFYAKRARRILPAATVVLVVTAVLAFMFLPQIRWRDIGADIIGSAIYLVNWRFAAGTDYLNAEVAASPLQHFWTLAVEEQFYIVWPLVIVLLLVIAGLIRKGDATRLRLRLLRFGALLLLVPSLLWSISLTASNPGPAYFLTTTRLWELAIGALVAVFAVKLERVPDAFGFALGWLGLAGILAASLWYTAATAFPGYAALLPTLSAAAVIIGGMNDRATRGAGALLSLQPMRWVGDISYSLYLWHWPLIVVATYLLGDELRFRYGLLVVALAFIPSWLSYRFVENPFRNWPRLKERARASLVAGGVLVLVSAVVGAGLFVGPSLTQQPRSTADSALGAMALDGNPAAGDPVDVVDGGFTPTALEARDDNPEVYESGCHVKQDGTDFSGCTRGDADGQTTVALVGDSHAASWAPTMENLAEKHGWKLRVYTASACGFADVVVALGTGERYDNCTDWNNAVMAQLIEEKPDLVVTTNSVNRKVWGDGKALSMEESAEPFSEGLHRSWSELNEHGIPVTVIRDVARVDIDIPECVSANPEQLTECAVPRSVALDDRPAPETDAAVGLPETKLVDMNPWICPGKECPAVIGNVMVWRDGHHLTATYAETLTEPLDRALREASALP